MGPGQPGGPRGTDPSWAKPPSWAPEGRRRSPHTFSLRRPQGCVSPPGAAVRIRTPLHPPPTQTQSPSTQGVTFWPGGRVPGRVPGRTGNRALKFSLGGSHPEAVGICLRARDPASQVSCGSQPLGTSALTGVRGGCWGWSRRRGSGRCRCRRSGAL